ncbi:MAG TPA: helix-turn-helix transcriptional regulator [Phycisphaerae bacterium]|nr:helix-turn-helix transcriptional regulator [Phycisphaerae bacterium]
MTITLSNDRGWLEQMAEREDYGPVSAGGLVVRALGGDEGQPFGRRPRALGRLVELARRKKGLTLPELAEKADIDLVEALAIELDALSQPQPRTLFGLAEALGLPVGGVMSLAGLAQRPDDKLAAAAVRFAAKAEPTARLTDEEKEALEEFVGVLGEVSDGQ